jgi:hypothetical protein
VGCEKPALDVTDLELLNSPTDVKGVSGYVLIHPKRRVAIFTPFTDPRFCPSLSVSSR